MIRLLWIPVLGTVLSLIAIALAHPEREQKKPEYEYDTGCADGGDAGTVEPEEMDDGEEEPPPFVPPAEEPDPEPVLVELREDGKIGVSGGELVFNSIADFIKEFEVEKGAKRPPISITNASDKVTRDALQKVAAEVAGKLDLRIDFRAPGGG